MLNRPFTAEEIEWHKQWRPASGHPGGWRVVRQDFTPGVDSMLHQHTGPKGRLVLFRSHDAAKRRADRLNRATVAEALAAEK